MKQTVKFLVVAAVAVSINLLVSTAFAEAAHVGSAGSRSSSQVVRYHGGGLPRGWILRWTLRWRLGLGLGLARLVSVLGFRRTLTRRGHTTTTGTITTATTLTRRPRTTRHRRSTVRRQPSTTIHLHRHPWRTVHSNRLLTVRFHRQPWIEIRIRLHRHRRHGLNGHHNPNAMTRVNRSPWRMSRRWQPRASVTTSSSATSAIPRRCIT